VGANERKRLRRLLPVLTVGSLPHPLSPHTHTHTFLLSVPFTRFLSPVCLLTCTHTHGHTHFPSHPRRPQFHPSPSRPPHQSSNMYYGYMEAAHGNQWSSLYCIFEYTIGLRFFLYISAAELQHTTRFKRLSLPEKVEERRSCI